MKRILEPRSKLIEKTAGEMAAVFYEAGRSTGLKSKHKSARAYAKANLEKFVPKAVEILIGMLGMPHISDIMKTEIYEALQERLNDPELKVFDLPKSANGISVSETARDLIANFDPDLFKPKKH